MGTWVHWILYNIPGDKQSLSEAIPPDASLPDGSMHGKNSWGRLDYGGPCPPSGTHRYFFKLYALDTVIDLRAGGSKEELLRTMGGSHPRRGRIDGVVQQKIVDLVIIPSPQVRVQHRKFSPMDRMRLGRVRLGKAIQNRNAKGQRKR